jgi:hypothetical protein
MGIYEKIVEIDLGFGGFGGFGIFGIDLTS